MAEENDKQPWDMGVNVLKIEPGTSRNPCRAATHQTVIFDKRSEKSRKVNWMEQSNENNDNNNNNSNTKWNKKEYKNVE